MKKIIICVSLLALTGSAFAAGKPGFFDNLLKGLKSKIGSKLESKNRVASVAAVRGKNQGADAAYALYWKGGVSEKAQKKLAAEKQQFTDAVQLVVDEDVAGGKAALEKFIKNNPDSVYLPEAKEALENLPEQAVTEGGAGGGDKPAEAPKKPAKPADDEEE